MVSLSSTLGIFLLLSYTLAIDPDLISSLRDENEDDIAVCFEDKKCPHQSVLSASLALSILRLSSSLTESFVFSPLSLGSALAIAHDGASGVTQEELTNLLLPGCTASDVTHHYSSLAHSFPTQNENVSFSSVNRMFVNETFSLRDEYREHVRGQYKVEVEKVNFYEKKHAADVINKFVDDSTNRTINQIITDKDIVANETVAVLINAITFRGLWETRFYANKDETKTFRGVEGDREVIFMRKVDQTIPVNLDNDFGTAVVMPYMDNDFKFFMLMPNETSSNRTSDIETMITTLTGETLFNILSNAKDAYFLELHMPVFEVKSKLDGKELLTKMGVSTIFSEEADFSKFSDTETNISKIAHSAAIKVNELGTEASAVTALVWRITANHHDALSITFDRPFLFGIIRNADILFLGQHV